MSLGFTTSRPIAQADADWLSRLTAAVPLAEGRMEIVADWRSAAAYLALGAGGAIAIVIALVAEPGRQWQDAPLFLGAAAIAAGIAVFQARRLSAARRRRPVMVLSAAGLTRGDRHVAWDTVSQLHWRRTGLGGHVRSECRLELANDDWITVPLDGLELPPQRVMLLLEYYWSGSRDDLPPWHWRRRLDDANASRS
jgi:hypothetical protein